MIIPCKFSLQPGPGARATCAAALAMLLGLMPASSTAAADDASAKFDLNKGLARVAGHIKAALADLGESSVAIGAFTPPARLAASSGAGIAKTLEEELRKQEIQIQRSAKLEVNGEYRDMEDAQQRVSVLIKVRLVDQASASVRGQFQSTIGNLTSVATLLGASMSVPADAVPAAREQVIREAIESPHVHLANTRIAAASDSPYAIEIMVRPAKGKDYRPRAATSDNGQAFMNIRKDEVYAIKLINDSPYDAAITLTVDGLNVFAFSEKKGYTYMVVAAHSTGTVQGWHRNNAVSNEFVVTRYAESAAARALPSSAGLGVVTACFAAAWPVKGDPPADEPDGRSVTATGRGAEIRTQYGEVVRHTGKLRASVSVRYTKEDDPKDLPKP